MGNVESDVKQIDWLLQGSGISTKELKLEEY